MWGALGDATVCVFVVGATDIWRVVQSSWGAVEVRGMLQRCSGDAGFAVIRRPL